MFSDEFHSEYINTNDRIHNKTSSMVGIPSIIRHIAYWKPDNSDRSTWIKAIDKRLLLIYCNLHKIPKISLWTNVSNKLQERIVLFGSFGNIREERLECLDEEKIMPEEYQVILYSFRWHGIRATIRSELFVEFFSISIILDLSYSVDLKDNTAKQLVEIYGSLDNLINTSEINADALQVVHEYLYKTVWKEFHEDILCPQDPTQSKEGSSPQKNQPDNEIGKIFADFRVLLTGGDIRKREDNKKQYRVFDHDGSILFKKPNISGVDSAEVATVSGDILPNQAKDALKKLWPFLISDSSCPLNEYELTASLMSDRCMFYTTAMAPQRSDRKKEVPLFALHYWNTDNRWRIGRLIDRLNYAGTVRLASMIDFEQLRKYSNDLRGIQEIIENVRLQMPSSDSIEEFKNMQEDLARAHEVLKGHNVCGGASYRILRSRIYIKQFNAAIKSLRLKDGKIDGYQKYDEFVFRRLGLIFDFIESLGDRYVQAKKDITSLSQFILSREISVASKKIKELQIFGEAALIAVLLPYYLGNITSHIFHLKNKPLTEQFIWMFITIGCGWWAANKLFDHGKISQNPKDLPFIKSILNFFISVRRQYLRILEKRGLHTK